MEETYDRYTSHPEIPEYSVHDIVRIGQSKKKIEYFMDERIFVVDDVPDDYELGDAQQMQVRAHKSQKPIIDIHEPRNKPFNSVAHFSSGLCCKS